MSRYEMNKLILYLDADGERMREFHADPAGYVATWVERAATNRLPVEDGGSLTGEEQQALAARDYGELYRLGVHPYLLLHFARALDVVLDGTAWPEFVPAYKDRVRPHGFPDFST